MKKELPEHFKKFVDKYPDIWEAHQKMTEASAECGPLERKMRELIKVAASAAAGLETPVERHAVMAVQEGATEDEIYQTIMQLVTIVGFPRVSAALKWAERALVSDS
jgi:4-carboxymuconolactone decarboxylase